MAQKGSGKRRQAPAYSADAMAIRYMAGLALIALGVLIFMAAVTLVYYLVPQKGQWIVLLLANIPS